MTKIQWIKYISIFLILLTNVLLVQGNELKQFNIEDEYFSIQPIITNFCNVEQTSVFHIVRLNYSTNPNPYYLNYVQFLDFENEIIIEKNIVKELKSYTKANTGFVQFNLSGKYDLSFNLDNVSLSWGYNVSCEDNDETGINQTENETTEEFQILFNINTDKDIYIRGEKVKIYFNNVNTSKPFQISYWVEDLRGNIVKSKYTTQNTNYKSFTPSFEEIEKGFVVKATLYQEGLEKSDDKLFSFVNEDYVSSNVNNFIDLKEVKFNYVSKTVNFEMLIEKNEGLKRIVEINGKNAEGKKVCNTLKLDLLTKGKIKVYGSLYCDLNKLIESEEFIFVVDGLNVSRHENIYVDKENLDEKKESSWNIINQSTRKQYAEGNLTWYVKIRGDGEALLLIQNGEDLIIEKINVSGEKTFNFVFEALPEMNVIAKLYPFKELFEKQTSINLVSQKKDEKKVDLMFENTSLITSEVIKNDFLTGNVVLEEDNSNHLVRKEVKNILMGAVLLGVLVFGGFLFFFKQK